MAVITTGGYVAVFLPDHPMANRNGYIYEHRLVVSEHLGRPLESWEHVHHKDENKQNNAIENLELTTDAEHRVRHRKTTQRLRMPDEANTSIPCACGCGQMFLRFDSSGRARRYISGHNKTKANTKGV